MSFFQNELASCPRRRQVKQMSKTEWLNALQEQVKEKKSVQKEKQMEIEASNQREGELRQSMFRKQADINNNSVDSNTSPVSNETVSQNDPITTTTISSNPETSPPKPKEDRTQELRSLTAADLRRMRQSVAISVEDSESDRISNDGAEERQKPSPPRVIKKTPTAPPTEQKKKPRKQPQSLPPRRRSAKSKNNEPQVKQIQTERDEYRRENDRMRKQLAEEKRAANSKNASREKQVQKLQAQRDEFKSENHSLKKQMAEQKELIEKLRRSIALKTEKLPKIEVAEIKDMKKKKSTKELRRRKYAVVDDSEKKDGMDRAVSLPVIKTTTVLKTNDENDLEASTQFVSCEESPSKIFE